MSTFFDNLIMIRRYHVWWAIEDIFQGAKSFVKQLSLIAVEIALVNLIKWAILCKLIRVKPNISSFLIRWCKYARD